MATLGEHRGAVNRLAVAQVGMGVIEGTNDVYLCIYMCVCMCVRGIWMCLAVRAQNMPMIVTHARHTHTHFTRRTTSPQPNPLKPTNHKTQRTTPSWPRARTTAPSRSGSSRGSTRPSAPAPR